jgi:hypothetical protein
VSEPLDIGVAPDGDETGTAFFAAARVCDGLSGKRFELLLGEADPPITG